MSGATAHIPHFASPPNLIRKTVQNFAVERFALKLVINPASVFVRNAVVAFANSVCGVVNHTSGSESVLHMELYQA
jgi:hypothetical protein